MKTFMYARRNGQNERRLEAAVQERIPKGRIERFEKLDDFGRRLRLPVEPDSVAVLSAANREELLRMKSLQGMMTEIYVILVIPDRKKSTIDLAHLLLPRFLCQREDDFTDLKSVLNKMYLNSQLAPAL
ncbi:MAG: hypothetical protein PHI34_04275 [Acidobacteriota bacterium]|nr:hypothetical protein [Acidobacteriota bacterium]